MKMDLKIATEHLNIYLADAYKCQNIDGLELNLIELSNFPNSDIINNFNNFDLKSKEESFANSTKKCLNR